MPPPAHDADYRQSVCAREHDRRESCVWMFDINHQGIQRIPNQKRNRDTPPHETRSWRRRMTETTKPRLVGINHVAIEVGDIDAALEWYGRLFAFTLRGKGERNAFIDMGDQFINMTQMSRPEGQDVERRHIGLVVDDRSRILELAKAAGARMVEGQFLDFLDPWGNRLEIIEYSNIQFTKAPHVLRGMGLALDKNEKARRELADKGMAEETGR
jgi:catechol 2,3-dioxygenase-like lactoylglutathione lyase family enzyme